MAIDSLAKAKKPASQLLDDRKRSAPDTVNSEDEDNLDVLSARVCKAQTKPLPYSLKQ